MANLNRLKVVLVEQEKTGKWLAHELGKSTCTVSKWCSNSTQPDLYTLEKIANLLGVDKRELLTASDNKQNKI
ncbi:helix-turn-helix transcriptional regulator [Hallella faecis]|uniref:Helix-turn-helix transcriptional regulator n=1 Tax=Hallella faecis TaxID=2841596 RepID=A0ABV1FQP7_9BACT|nr:helix-turn-helix transcriptional regulator [Hallella faecis]MBU0289949.1 helix-turn-helix transcriptional regulator [Hallella faecis]